MLQVYKKPIRGKQCRKHNKPEPKCDLRCEESNESITSKCEDHLEPCTSETEYPGFHSIQDMFPKPSKPPSSKRGVDTNEQSTPSEKKKPHKRKACMAVPVKQSNKSINHDSSEDHTSSPEDPEPMCDDWEEHSCYIT